MTHVLVNLYEKYVPAPVREYIDETDTSAPTRSRRNPRPTTPKPVEDMEVTQ